MNQGRVGYIKLSMDGLGLCRVYKVKQGGIRVGQDVLS